ncbi:hypothetical protein ACNI3K_08865 [Demequina sp. SO4-13]|uniref:hypothetical protein n=1 Tax=Demequina sp. SO4-13 TaxID=3401027 RepID=UPI003AF53EEE
MDTEVVGELLERDSAFTTAGHADHVVSELLGIGLGHNNILPGSPEEQARSDVTYCCGRPGCPEAA